MSLRLRLALWYGALLSTVLGLALGAAYVVHSTTHFTDVDAALRSSWEHAAKEFAAIGRLEPPPPATSGASGVWMLRETDVVASAGDVDDPVLRDLAPRQLSDGYATMTLSQGRARSYAAPVGDAVRLIAATSLAPLDLSLARLRLILVGLGLGGVVFGVGIGWAISGGALRPIATLTETARAIALSRGFSRRVEVPAGDRDELASLGRTFNAMLASLDDAYRRQQRFVGDVSHELRTPLTTIQGNAEVLTRDRIDDHERIDAAEHILRESGRLARLVDDLLVLARADAGPQPFLGHQVQLDEVVLEAVAELGPQVGPRLRLTGFEPAVVSGERDRLKQLTLALLDNALRYTRNGGGVALWLGLDGSEAVLRVDDDGIGVSPEVVARAFERFYRGAEARRLDPSGTGLGLAIARWIVLRHGGTITLEPRSPRGTSAVVRLPLSTT